MNIEKLILTMNIYNLELMKKIVLNVYNSLEKKDEKTSIDETLRTINKEIMNMHNRIYNIDTKFIEV